MDAGNVLVHLQLLPRWSYVDAVREFCGHLARTTFGNDVAEQRVGMVVHELVENAIRYGHERALDVLLARSDTDVVVRVESAATDEEAQNLRELIEDLHRQEPEAAYLGALRVAAARPQHESRIGLPRIRYEGRVDLSLETTIGTVAITARGAI